MAPGSSGASTAREGGSDWEGELVRRAGGQRAPAGRSPGRRSAYAERASADAARASTATPPERPPQTLLRRLQHENRQLSANFDNVRGRVCSGSGAGFECICARRRECMHCRGDAPLGLTRSTRPLHPRAAQGPAPAAGGGARAAAEPP